MPRTTLDLEGPVLLELKALQESSGASLGQLASELLAEALASRRAQPPEPEPFLWTARAMQARVDLEDKEALYAALDEDSDSVNEGPAE